MHYGKQCTFFKNIKGFLVTTQKLLIKCMLGLAIGLSSFLTAAATIEGYWRSINERTGEQLSIIEIRKNADKTFTGKIVYTYPSGQGKLITHCVNCPAPYTGKPRLGLPILTQVIEDPDRPNHYINGRVLDSLTGKTYKGKARISTDGKRLTLRGYVGVSLLGRSVVWIRTNSANP